MTVVSDASPLLLSTSQHTASLSGNTERASSLLPFPGAFLAVELSAVLLLLPLLPLVSVALQDGRDGGTAATARSEHTQGVREGGRGDDYREGGGGNKTTGSLANTVIQYH